MNLLNMWFVIITTIFGGLVLTIIILSLKDRRKRILGNQLPGPKGLFIIGNLLLFLQTPEKVIKDGLILYRKNEKSLFKLWIFNHLFVILTKPEDIESVLSNPKCLKKSQEYTLIHDYVEKGILTNNNIREWKHYRKLVVKGLGIEKLKSLIPLFYHEAKDLVEILQNKCDFKSKDCDISLPIEMATMEIIGKSALGVTFNAQRDGRHKFIEAVHTCFHVLRYKLFHPWLMNNTLFRFSSLKRDSDPHFKLGLEFIDELIKSKLVELNCNENSTEINTDNESDYQKPKTILDILLQSSHDMSFKRIREEILTIIIAGQDTVATAIAIAVFMLAHHQDVQNKVFDELQSIFLSGDYERPPTFEDLQQMNYLERVIKETLRLFPSAPVFGRALEEDMEIGGFLCPAGATLAVLPMFLQTSPLYYTNPNQFDPDNFLPDACKNRHPYAYIPFSAGQRSCIGGKYAMLQMKTVLSTLVRKLKFSPSDRCPKTENLRVLFPITLKFIDGCHVKLELRN